MNSSTNSDRHPYLRKECWEVGTYNNKRELVSPPLLDNFTNTTDRNQERLRYMLKKWPQVVEYNW